MRWKWSANVTIKMGVGVQMAMPTNTLEIQL